MLDTLKWRNIPLPPIETEENLTAQNIMNKIRSFYSRYSLSQHNVDSEFMEKDFLELLADYPKSMCARQLTEELKMLIALAYLAFKPKETPKEGDWKGYSYEYLGIVFDRSKATIHEAIVQKEAQAKQLLENVKLRTEARSIALEELVKEEKEKLKQKQPKE